MRAGRFVALLALLIAVVVGCSHPERVAEPPSYSPAPNALPLRTAPPNDPTAAKMLAYLKDETFTGSAIVVRHGEVLVRYAEGQADEKADVPNRPDTVYRLASVSKQFTAMVVLKLRDRGLLRLDDPICRYLEPTYVDPCPKAWKPITIQQVLVHTSGIPDISEFPHFFDWLDRPTTPKGLIARFDHKPLDFPPGERWKYSNSGYIVAGAVIEKVTGHPYGQALHDEITGPLRLEHTGYTPEQPPDGYAKGYLSKGDPAGTTVGSQAYSAGGVYSTVDDLARWERALGAHLVASKKTVDKALTAQVDCPDEGCLGLPSSGYAYGWLVGELDGHRYLSHPGLLGGYHASDAYLPDDDIEVVVLSNVQDTDVNGIARHLADLALK